MPCPRAAAGLFAAGCGWFVTVIVGVAETRAVVRRVFTGLAPSRWLESLMGGGGVRHAVARRSAARLPLRAVVSPKLDRSASTLRVEGFHYAPVVIVCFTEVLRELRACRGTATRWWSVPALSRPRDAEVHVVIV